MHLRSEVGTTVPTPPSRTFDSDNKVDDGSGNLLPPHLLTILDIQGRPFPVYWKHYVCLRAMQSRMKCYLQQMARAPNCFEIQTDLLSEEDCLWGIMSLALVKRVEAKMSTRISSIQLILI